MKAGHFYKISYIILYVLLALTLVVVALFFGFGYDNPVGDVNRPLNTDLLLGLIYAMSALAVLVAAAAVMHQSACVWRENRKRACRLFAGTGLFVLLMLAAYLSASSLPVQVGGKQYAVVLWLKVADTLLYAVYILLGTALLCVALSVSGVFRHFHLKHRNHVSTAE